LKFNGGSRSVGILLIIASIDLDGVRNGNGQ
jgi:hypothetical protein